MICNDLLATVMLLIRWAIAALGGMDLDTVWQMLRSAAVRCSSGPLG